MTCDWWRESRLTPPSIQRLCEEEGIHFHFQHSSSGHKLVFGDNQTVFRKLKPVSYQQDSGMAAEKPVEFAGQTKQQRAGALQKPCKTAWRKPFRSLPKKLYPSPKLLQQRRNTACKNY
ncbi:hypothetical protein LJJ44_11260 [Pseudomonas sp. B24_DOA]|nr:hypothetical protein LJJ44_11260 [Pseudomonas sp. B24_DOA]WKV87761.1 hypothetical protein LJU32_19295 [Pseudomonas sp. B21_DOA]